MRDFKQVITVVAMVAIVLMFMEAIFTAILVFVGISILWLWGFEKPFTRQE